MSVIAGRAYAVIAAMVFLASLVWLLLGVTRLDSQPTATAVPAVTGLVALVALLAGLPLFGRFGEVSIERGALVIRSVFRPRRTVALGEIADVTVIEALVLPARAATSVRRLVIRTRMGRTIAVTPRDGRVLDQLRVLSVSLTVDREPLTPAQAVHRYPASTSLPERLLGQALWAAVLVPLIVVIWVVLSR